MAQYELMVILSPTLEEEEVSEAVEKLKSLISERGGTEATTDIQGRRRLAYPVKDQRDGVIALSRFDMSPQQVVGIESGLRRDDRYLRTMLIRL